MRHPKLSDGPEQLREEKVSLQRLNKALRMITKCDQVLVRATDETALLKEICRTILDVGGYRLTWVGYAENDSRKTVRPVAQAGFEEGYLDTLNVTWADEPQGKGPTGTAIRTGKSIVIPDIRTDISFEPWREEASRRGYRARIALPLIANGETFGALNIYAEDADIFGDVEAELLMQLTTNLAYGVSGLRARVDLQKAAQKISENESLFRLITENVMDLIAVLDTSGKRIYNSPSYARIFGDQKTLMGTDSMAEIHPDDRERIKHVFDETVATGIGQRTEYRFLLPDGSMRFIESQGSVIRDSSGAVSQVLVVSRDVTSRKRAEEERAVLQEQLRQAQRLESIGTLWGGIAHDFNNVLSIILGYTALLDRLRDNPEEHRKAVDVLTNTIQRGAKLTRQLLMFARRTEVEVTLFDVNTQIDDLARMLLATLPKTIRVVLEKGANIPACNADAGQINQALLNLCVNARDAMPDGGTMTIATSVVSGEILHGRFGSAEDMQYLCIRVTDTGTGMDEATRGRMFEPFFTTKGEGIGTGLGLAVVYGVVKSHRGFIDVDTKPGVGTTFSLYFPLPAKEAQEGIATTEVVAPAPRGSGETVLVVEDEGAILGILKDVLELNGYSVLTATDGAEAVDLYRTKWKDIGVVLSDIGLPRQDGVEAFLMMKEINPSAKVIFATGYLDPNLREQIMRKGSCGFLQKPYVSQEVLKTLRRVLDTGH